MSADTMGGQRSSSSGLQLPAGPARAPRGKGIYVAPRAASGPDRGTMLLADISGYTAFLQGVAEAHAADMRAGRFVPEAYPLLASLLDGIQTRG
jgi:hypothetical protein